MTRDQGDRLSRSAEAFPRAVRIRRGAEIQAVLAARNSAAGRYIVVHLLSNSQPTSRLGLAVSRRVGGAVTRNRVRRRLRESFRRRLRVHLDARHGTVDVVLRALPAAAGATQAELEADVLSTLTRLEARRKPRSPPEAAAPEPGA